MGYRIQRQRKMLRLQMLLRRMRVVVYIRNEETDALEGDALAHHPMAFVSDKRRRMGDQVS